MEERLNKLEAEAEIGRLLVQYATALDARDFKTYVGLFTEDGEWAGGFGKYKGHAEIEGMLIGAFGETPPGFVNVSNFHSVANPMVTVTGDTASATSMFLVWARTATEPPQPKPVLAGRYVDEFVKLGGEWKIARRTAHDMIPFKDPHDPDRPDPGRKAGPSALDPNSVEARLRRVEDELAIQRVLVDYSTRLQALDIDAYVQVFAKDGAWHNGTEYFKGHDQLRELLIGLFGAGRPVDYMNGRSYQIIHNWQIDLDGDTAKVRSRHTLFRRDEDGNPRPVLSGIYLDDFIREDGQWKILFRDDYPVIPTREEWEANRGM